MKIKRLYTSNPTSHNPLYQPNLSSKEDIRYTSLFMKRKSCETFLTKKKCCYTLSVYRKKYPFEKLAQIYGTLPSLYRDAIVYTLINQKSATLDQNSGFL